MRLQSVTVKNFRCFPSLSIDFEQQTVLIEGANGSGKTSLLEALHYACYLRSFRTHAPSELVREGSESFFVKAVVAGGDAASYELQVGFADKKRLVKLDHRPVTTYKELLDIYRIVTITEDDLDLVRDGPEVRRSFIDQVCIFKYPEYAKLMRHFRHVLNTRNALLKRSQFNRELYDLWSAELWKATHPIATMRHAVVQQLEQHINALIDHYFKNQFTVQMRYGPCIDYKDSYEQFLPTVQAKMKDETRFGRSLFGAHLDDIIILFQEHRSRSYASRGQQKLIVLLIKMAQVKLLDKSVILLDDFMTDFDQQRITDLIKVLRTLNCQLIFTVPLASTPLSHALDEWPFQRVNLTQ